MENPFDTLNPLSREARRTFNWMYGLCRRVEGLSGPHVVNSEDGIFIDTPPGLDRPFSTWFKVISHSEQGSTSSTPPNQWDYVLSQVHKTGNGYGGWAVVSTGLVNVAGFNSFEDINDGTGVEGNGIDFSGSDFPAGFEMQPVPINSIVWGTVVYTTSLVREVWFSFVNAVDGTCT